MDPEPVKSQTLLCSARLGSGSSRTLMQGYSFSFFFPLRRVRSGKSHRCTLMAPDEGKERFNTAQGGVEPAKKLKEIQHSSFNRAPGFIILRLALSQPVSPSLLHHFSNFPVIVFNHSSRHPSWPVPLLPFFCLPHHLSTIPPSFHVSLSDFLLSILPDGHN